LTIDPSNCAYTLAGVAVGQCYVGSVAVDRRPMSLTRNNVRRRYADADRGTVEHVGAGQMVSCRGRHWRAPASGRWRRSAPGSRCGRARRSRFAVRDFSSTGRCRPSPTRLHGAPRSGGSCSRRGGCGDPCSSRRPLCARSTCRTASGSCMSTRCPSVRVVLVAGWRLKGTFVLVPSQPPLAAQHVSRFMTRDGPHVKRAKLE
ncbi:hypothetical protein PBRA_000559, partial [Plasmodiophora brassicae]